MVAKELFEYYLEKAGYNNPRNSIEKDEEIYQKTYDEILNPKTKKGKIFRDYFILEALEGKGTDIIEEDALINDFESYKEIVLKLLKNMPDDYDLKADLVFDDINYENFDDRSYEIYRASRIHKVIMQEIQGEYDVGDLSFEELGEIVAEKFEKYGLEEIKPNTELVIKKLNSFLKEIERKIEESNIQRKYGFYSNFVLGRMYLRIIEKLYFIYDSFGEETLKEKHEVLMKNFEKDHTQDIYYRHNELGFLSYVLDDRKTYEKICDFNRLSNKRGLIEYFLSNIDNIFKKENNSKYLNNIIKKNFFFFPILIFKSEAGLGGRKLINLSKGRYDEAIKMVHYYVVYLTNHFKNANDSLIKDFMYSIEDYFNYYFNDDGVRYSFFKILEDYYMDDKEIFLIENLKKDYNEKCGEINNEDFQKVFKDLCDTKLIKKCNQFNFLINDEMDLITAFDLDGDSFINDIDEEDQEDDEMINMFKA